jgi:hypothetical protein
MTIDTTTEDRLLTEVERQQKYLNKLPEDFSFPLFNAAQALESQRRSGYRNTAAAAREIIDNAIEAKATRIDICFERPKQLKQHQRADSIYAIAFIDNGSGMLPTMARYALSWGAGTHFDDPGFIGKFGFGLPNASINQTKLVEVYTKTADADVITKAVLDARMVKEHGLTAIDPPVEANLPDFVQAYLDKNGLPFDHGTVVVWVEPDRISYRRPALMKEHLVDDFGVTYRYLLQSVAIHVDGMQVQAVDPLFLEEHARYYLAPEKKGAIMSADWNIPVKYARDPETGALALSKIDVEADIDAEDGDVEAIGAIYVRVARFPYGFAEAVKGQKGTTDANRRFEIRKNRRGMSFVRAGREIETVDVFPKTAKEHSKGMGDWPLLQSYAYHWGVEVRFDPILDEVFGITNDKQTVRPIEDLWRLLAAEKIDAQLGREQTYQRKTREEHKKKEKAAKAERAAQATIAESAAAAADGMAGKKPRVADRDKPKAREDFEAEVTRRSKIDEVSKDAARQALLDEAKRRPYVIDFYDESRGPFYKPEWLNGQQVAVMINKQHSFFQTLYAPLLELGNAGDAKQALDVLLIALARAELDVDDGEPRDWYITQRERVWSSFLDDAYRSLQQKLAPSDEEATEANSDGDEEEDLPEQAAA